MKKIAKLSAALISGAIIGLTPQNADACTGIRLMSEDSGVVYGRSMEWGAFDLHSRVVIIPKGYTSTALTPEGNNGIEYTAKYGIVGLDMLKKKFISDGMNEKGLAIGLFYHPGFAKYAPYDKASAKQSLAAQELTNYILSQFSTVDEVREELPKLKVVGVVEKAIGIEVGAHWMVTDASGKSIVIEYTNEELKIHDAPLGVITNSPNYDWHMTNLQNYVNLSMYAVTSKKLNEIKIAPTGAGSGMIGLPGDNTPPSRFIRAIAWTQTARKLNTAEEGVYETFRILDNFQLPLGPDGAEGASEEQSDDLMRASTIWTTAWNLNDLTLNFHTQHNRRVRQVKIKEIDFSKKDITYLELDPKKEQDILDLTPAK